MRAEHTRRWRSRLPLLLVILALVTLAALPLLVQRKIGVLRREIAGVADPARSRLAEIHLALALETAGTRGFLLTGDAAYAAAHAEARGRRRRAYERLLPLSQRLDPRIHAEVVGLGERLRPAEALPDALFSGRIRPDRYLALLLEQQARLQAVTETLTRLDREISRASAVRRAEIEQAERVGAGLTVLLVLLAMAAALLVARLGTRYRELARRLDARARREASLREVARELGASLRVREVVDTISERAVSTTRAFGAYVERSVIPEPGTEVEVVAHAGEGVPPLGTRAPYPGSLTEEMMESGEPEIMTEVGAIGERMAPYLKESCRGCSGLVVPLTSEGKVLGALVLLRGPEQKHFTSEEAAHARALGDLASAALRRVLLLEGLTESEARFRTLANNIPQLAWMADPAGRSFWFNQRWYDFTGGTPEEMQGWGWRGRVAPEHADRVADRFRAAFESGEPWEDTYPIRNADGDYRWFLSRAEPIRDAAGEVVRWFGTNTDVTARIEAERERERLLRREREARAEAEERREALERVTESRSRLMRGFSHDVKNPLGAADGYLQLMEEGLMDPLTEKQEESVGKVRRSIRAALNLIEDLLELARAEAGEIEVERAPTDLRDVAGEAAEEYHAAAEAEGLSLTVELPDELPVVESDAGRVRQVLSNLLSNAVKYTREGSITVRAEVREGGAAPGPGRWIAVDVGDTGPGIPEEQQRLLFQEFRRLETAGEEKGAGIGLAISRRIAQALGGDVTVESEVGKGSTFTLWLPTGSAGQHPVARMKQAAD